MTTISLSSNSSNYTSVLSGLELYDISNITINLNDLYYGVIPTYMKIDWGDGSRVEAYDNELFKFGRENSNLLFLPELFQNTPSKEYTPSLSALYKSLSAQVLVNYINGDYTYFVIPITLRGKSLMEIFNNTKIENVVSLENSQEIQIKSDNGLMEIIIPPST